MLKTRSIAIFITLFVFIFTYLHATPLPCEKAVAIFEYLVGEVTFEQGGENITNFNGEFKQGFDENAPDKYFINIGGVYQGTFADYNITIDPPGAGPWKATLPGNLSSLDVSSKNGVAFMVFKENNVLELALIWPSAC
ncbi:hypothetical protein C2G38_2209985 [Gigaspora rosea]|uniref:Uncharacterized protein n=1 Tax=Gigaspora rosea TaxID=44941 RepID=A0A397UNS6_9GLOM|nr:hypothetical protein C2G38_2209985 [Gigaspora rosea]